MEELDFELRKTYELTVRATDIQTGSYAEAIVHVQLEVNIYEYITSFRRKKKERCMWQGWLFRSTNTLWSLSYGEFCFPR